VLTYHSSNQTISSMTIIKSVSLRKQKILSMSDRDSISRLLQRKKSNGLTYAMAVGAITCRFAPSTADYKNKRMRTYTFMH
jgi:hypothetical protein